MPATDVVESHHLHGGNAMSRTLNLAERLLARGRNFQELGRRQDALHILGRLAGFRHLPAAVAEETQVRLAEIWLARRKYRRARRHLTAALVHQPACPRYHYLMGAALAGDPKGDRQRAAHHYRQALQLDPKQPDRLSEFGLLALQLGQTDEGFECLRRAVELAPADPSVVSRLVEGLRSEGRIDEARRALQAALFRNPRDARFRQLWNDFQFQQLRREQEQERRRDLLANETDGPTLLPFVRPAPGTVPFQQGKKRVRRDGPSAPAPPHTTRPARLPQQRHAQ
jgi:tetratricopeptide (TPR) repeat protein